MTRFRRSIIRVLFGVLVTSSLLVGSAPVAKAAVFTALTLKNGWSSAPQTRIAEVTIISGIVHFRGGITANGEAANAFPFVLPAAFRPVTDVYVPVSVFNRNTGRLWIRPNGVVKVEAPAFSDASTLTSLDGASFARAATGFTALALQNGWTNAPFSTSNAAAKLISGIVHLKGAIATNGANFEPFVLPASFRPVKNVYVVIDLCGANTGGCSSNPRAS